MQNITQILDTLGLLWAAFVVLAVFVAGFFLGRRWLNTLGFFATDDETRRAAKYYGGGRSGVAMLRGDRADHERMKRQGL